MKRINADEKLTFDMTPMIDCTFQLVIFFMLTLNYSQQDLDDRIKLPGSELAKPVEVVPETSIVLQLTPQGTILTGGDEIPLSGLKNLLARERKVIEGSRRRKLGDAIIVIRADRDALTGRVQQIIKVSQETGFEKFVLRAKEDYVNRIQGG
jgi:biopolymer transport protein ExbD